MTTIIQKLSITSPIQSTPILAKFELWDHQKAMLYKCIEIEFKEKFGVLADKPGTGKTFVVLSLILSSINNITKNSKCNLIIVPHNIYSQWDKSIRDFCDLSKVIYKQMTNYSEISNLYSLLNQNKTDNIIKSSLKDTNIILTTYLYYHIVASAINDLGIELHRVFLDEIDSINEMIKSPIKSNMTWFVSASFNNEKIGSYRNIISNLSLENNTCVCSDELIEKSIVLPAPIEHKLSCYNLIIELVLDILPKDTIAELNALDYNTSIYKFISKIPKNEKEFLEFLFLDINEILTHHQNNIQSLSLAKKEVESSGFYEGDILNQKVNSIKKQIVISQNILVGTNNLRVQLYEKIKKNKICAFTLDTLDNQSKYISKCCGVYYKKDAINKSITCCICNKIIEYPTGFLEERILLKRNQSSKNKEKYKIDVFRDLAIKLSRENNNSKTIIFSDYPFIFRDIEDFFKKNDISFTTLDSGSREALDKSIEEYKNGSSSFLLVDSSLNGCGMNLENTDNIIFIHKTKDELERQVVGRCQRPGRKTILNIYRLLHTNEITKIEMRLDSN